MNFRTQLQQRLELIALTIDPQSTVCHDFDNGAFIVQAADRRDVPLSENFVADRSDVQVADEIRLRWQLR